MEKEDFKKTYDEYLNNQQEVPKADIKKEDKKKVKQIMTTLTLDINMLDKIRGIAYLKRLKLKQVFKEAFTEYINNYEANQGAIKTPSSVND